MAGLIVHEWVARAGGSENVVDEFVRAFPDADLQVLWSDVPERYGRTPLAETWLAHTPLRNHKALALPFLPATWRARKARREYDWMLTSSHLFAHHVKLRNVDLPVPKYSYVHTPARYIWEPDLDRRGRTLPVRLASGLLKPLDRKRAQESVKIAANSEFTRDRIRRAWDRDADVIYPPVGTNRIINGGNWAERLAGADRDRLDSLPADFLLGASRFVPYKRLDRVIEAGEATGTPVVIAGRGPNEADLRARAEGSTVPVHFVISPSDELLFSLYQRSLAYVFPAIEDFGIMPVEAMAAGAPVVVAPTGGAVESVMAIQGGAAVREFTQAGWSAAVAEALKVPRASLPARAQRFSSERFRLEIADWMPAS